VTEGIPRKFKECVVTDLPKFVEVTGHHKPAPFWITPEMFPGVHMRLAGMDVSKAVGAPHAVPHVHDCPEIYFCPSEKKGAVLVEIQMDDEIFSLDSPFTVFIPPGVKHCFKVLKCDSSHYVFGVMPLDWKKP
jgi:hypothetical protein